MTICLPDFSNARVLVIGDIMLDRYWSGSTSRISPEAPVPVVKIDEIEDRLGGAANVAQNLSMLGCHVAICGIIGNDEAGTITKQLINESAIVDHTIVDEENPTITKLRVLSRHQQLLRMDFEELLIKTASQELTKRIDNIVSGYDAVILSDYAKGTVVNAKPIIAACQKHKATVFVDPKGSDFSRYHGASFITPNLSELESAVGKCHSQDEVFTKTKSLLQKTACQGILVTLSEKGMALIYQNEPPYHLPTLAQDVYDVTGAGDTVIATLTAAYAAGTDIQNAVRLANLAAGVVVGKLGTSTVTVPELQAALENEDKDLTKGLVVLNDLVTLVDLCKRKGEKIVFTNGCFDIVHAGHVRYLKHAASLGDKLIVGMNSDASIRRLKGSQRPIMSLKERIEVMCSLRCVDWVVVFDDDTPKAVIEQTTPDVLTKGGDYVAEDIVGYDIVTKSGGEVRVLPFVAGCSTTSIIERIKQLS